jgi:hypothetical protein
MDNAMAETKSQKQVLKLCNKLALPGLFSHMIRLDFLHR